MQFERLSCYLILNDNKDLIPKEKYRSRYASVFTLVVICVCIDIDVTENRAKLQRKGWDAYFIKAGHPYFIVLLEDHLLVNTSIGATYLSTWYAALFQKRGWIGECLMKLNLIQKSGISGTIYKKMLFRFLRNETYLFWIQGELFTQWVRVANQYRACNWKSKDLRDKNKLVNTWTWSVPNHNADKHKSEGKGSMNIMDIWRSVRKTNKVALFLSFRDTSLQ